MATPPRMRVLAGRTLTTLAIAFLALDGLIKLAPIRPVTDTLTQLGWPATTAMARFLGVLLLACLALHAWPPTALAGAVLLTGYLGGAIATQVRVANPLFSHVLFGCYVGLFVWGGLLLRDPRIGALMFDRRG